MIFYSNTEIQIPYPVEGLKNDVHFTYLDTVGRPVIVIHRKNSVDSHIRDFNVFYKTI
jgi:oligosaccharyltransferase complex subunit alpha (ribophorin I)